MNVLTAREAHYVAVIEQLAAAARSATERLHLLDDDAAKARLDAVRIQQRGNDLVIAALVHLGAELRAQESVLAERLAS